MPQPEIGLATIKSNTDLREQNVFRPTVPLSFERTLIPRSKRTCAVDFICRLRSVVFCRCAAQPRLVARECRNAAVTKASREVT